MLVYFEDFNNKYYFILRNNEICGILSINVKTVKSELFSHCFSKSSFLSRCRCITCTNGMVKFPLVYTCKECLKRSINLIITANLYTKNHLKSHM